MFTLRIRVNVFINVTSDLFNTTCEHTHAAALNSFTNLTKNLKIDDNGFVTLDDSESNFDSQHDKSKGLFTPNESEKDYRINGKHQRKFSLSLDLNTV